MTHVFSTGDAGFRAGFRLLTVSLVGLLASGCANFDRLKEVGRAPDLSPIENPVEQADYQPVSLPMPRSEPVTRNPNSLWQTGARHFFKDQRASVVGDILTVNIEITDNAAVNNSTSRSRSASEDAGITNLFGVENTIGDFLADPIDPTSLTDIDSSSNTTGTGQIARAETINLVVAALITQRLPNGNLVIQGRQEVRVNNEVRDLYISGVVRPEDITNTNTISHTQIAEARIAYGGRGDISDVQRPRYGQQIYELVFPF